MQIYAIFINEQTLIKRKKRKSTIFTPFDFLFFSVIPLRFERRTHALEGRCSIQLSYGTILNCGAKVCFYFELHKLFGGFMQTSKRFLCFPHANHRFSRAKPYVFRTGNIQFRTGKHRKLPGIFSIPQEDFRIYVPRFSPH